MNNPKSRIPLLLFALFVPAAALAAQPGWYLEADGGQTDFGGIAGTAQRSLSVPQPAQGWTVGGSSFSVQQSESNDTGYRVLVGYRFNAYLALEAGYVDLGNVHASGTGTAESAPTCNTPVCILLVQLDTYTGSAKVQAHGAELAVVGSWPISARWSLLGRVGAFDSHTRLDIASTPASPTPALVATSVSESSSNWRPTFGVGVSFSPVDHWALRLGWDRYPHLGDHSISGATLNASLFSLGVLYTL